MRDRYVFNTLKDFTGKTGAHIAIIVLTVFYGIAVKLIQSYGQINSSGIPSMVSQSAAGNCSTAEKVIGSLVSGAKGRSMSF